MSSLISRLTSPITWVVAALSIGYGFSRRGVNANSTQLELLVADLTNQQLLVNGFLVLTLFAALVRMRNALSVPYLLRFGTYTSLARRQAQIIAVWLLLLSVVWVVASFVTALGLPNPAGSDLGSQLGVGMTQIAVTFAFTFIVWMLFVAMRVAFDRTWVEVVAAVTLWAWMFAATAGVIPKDSLLDAGLYTNVPMMLAHPRAAAGAVTILIAIALATWIWIASHDQRPQWVARPWAVLFALTATVTFFAVAPSANTGTVQDVVTSTLFGTATVTQVLVSTFLLFGFAYTCSLTSSTTHTVRLYELIRYGSTARWAAVTLTRYAAAGAAYWTAVVLLGVTIYFLVGGMVVGDRPLQWLYQAIINGALRLTLVMIATVAVCLITRSTPATLAVIAVLIILRTFNLPHSPLTGAVSSTLDWGDGLNSTFLISGWLLISLITITGVLRFRRVPV